MAQNKAMSYLRRAIPNTRKVINAIEFRRHVSQSITRRGGGGDHHGPMMPPFARLAPPTETVKNEFKKSPISFKKIKLTCRSLTTFIDPRGGGISLGRFRCP